MPDRTPGPPGPPDPPMTEAQRELFASLTFRYLDGLLGRDDLAKLNHLLRTYPEARRLFTAYGQERFVLQDVLTSSREETDVLSVMAELAAAEESAGDSGIVDLTEELDRRRRSKIERERDRLRLAQPHGAPEPTKRIIVIPKPVAWLGLAAAVLAIGIALLPVLVGGPDTDAISDAGADGPHDAGPPPPAAPAPYPVATLVASDQAVWSGDTAPDIHDRLDTGHYALHAGTARLVMDSGAVVMVKGPVAFELDSSMRARLVDGVIVASVPEEAHGFTVACPGFDVVDLGTEFAVSLDRHQAQLRVVLGEVEVGMGRERIGAGPTPVLENELVRIDAQQGTIEALPIEQADDIAWALPYTELLGRNLVVNGDFETGTPGAARSAGDIDNIEIPGWEDDAPASVLNYEQAGALGPDAFPNPSTDPMPENRGRGYYVGGHAGTISQRIDLAGMSELIERGQAGFTLSGDLGGLLSQDDRVLVTVTFFDASGAVLSTAELDVVDAQARRGVSGFLYRSKTGSVPSAAVSAIVEMTAIHAGGGLTDAYADNIALVIDARSAANEAASHIPTPTTHPPVTSRAGLNR